MNYREEVKEAISAMDGRPVYNRSLEHAAVIIEEMFALAKKEVKLFTGELNANAYGLPPVRSSAAKFMADRNGKVRILIENQIAVEDLRKNPFIQHMPESASLEVRRLRTDEYDPEFHMMLADDRSYRFEPNKKEHAAVATFGDEETTGHLGKLFETLWNAGDVVKIQN